MKYLAAYLPSFANTVVYMLQKAEYSVGEYLEWLWTAADLRRVQTGPETTWTQKAKLLRLAMWLLMLSLYVIGDGLVLLELFSDETAWSVVLFGVAISLAAPMLAAHLLIIPLILGSVFIQRPREKRAYKQAQMIFAELNIPVIAIAGSFGKTSTRSVLVDVLSAGKKVATPKNNHNTPWGLSMFAHQIEDDAEVVVVELGEYVPGDVAYLAELVHPNIGVISGINRQHMMRMKTKERTIATVMELAEYIEPAKLYVNIESEWAQEAAKKANVKFDRKHVGGWKISDVTTGLEGVSFTMTKGKKSMSLSASVLGEYQIAPIAAAAVIAESLGMSEAEIQKGVESIRAFERRFEPKQLVDGVLLIDDTYNGNPSGFEAGMKFLSELDHDGRKIYATAGIIELGEEAHRVHVELGGRLANSNIDHVVFFDSPLSRVMHDAYIGAGGSAEVSLVESQVEFTRDIEHFVKSNDVLLIQNSQREEYFYYQ